MNENTMTPAELEAARARADARDHADIAEANRLLNAMASARDGMERLAFFLSQTTEGARASCISAALTMVREGVDPQTIDEGHFLKERIDAVDAAMSSSRPDPGAETCQQRQRKTIMTATKILSREHVGWNACRTIVVALCDDLIDKNPALGSQFASGMRTAARRIANELRTSEAEHCPVLLDELRKRWKARTPAMHGKKA